MRYEDINAVVTGAAGGIGAAIGRGLAARGARVVLTDLDEDRLRLTGEELQQSFPARVAFRAGNAADDSDIAGLIAETEALYGPVNLWVANAGVFAGFGLDAPDSTWVASWEVNTMAHVRAARALIPRWLEASHDRAPTSPAGDGLSSEPVGRFVVTASAAGLLTQLGSATYSASKHAAVGFAEWLATMYGDQGVQVTCLCPMGVSTAMIDSDDQPAEIDPHAQLARAAVTGAGDVVTAEAAAAAVLDAVESGTFLALPHPEVGTMYTKKAADPDRWIAGMQRLRQSLQWG